MVIPVTLFRSLSSSVTVLGVLSALLGEVVDLRPARIEIMSLVAIFGF